MSANQDLIKRLRTACSPESPLGKLCSEAADALSTPDHCYDPDNWEYTLQWDDRDQTHDYGTELPLGGVKRVATLINGPDRWAAHLPITWDENGDPDETEIEWFDTEESARSAFTRHVVTPPNLPTREEG